MSWTRAQTAAVAGICIVLAGIGATMAVKLIIRHRQAAAAAAQARWTANAARWRTEVWPGERSQAVERIKAGQDQDITTGAVTIDLTPYLNTKLTDAPLCWKGNNANNLAQLPSGKHIYAGVPFDVEGSIYLTGGWLKNHYHKHFPAKVEGIRIDRQCTKIHLLHAAGYVLYGDYGKPVARLVFHYADGSQRQTDILAGKNVCDMWVPLFTTGIPANFLSLSPGNEPAWTGSNAYIEKWQPDLSLVVYQSTFDNPQPAVTLASVDYVSTETVTVPVMLGLTVE